jgi:hypothetical protein
MGDPSGRSTMEKYSLPFYVAFHVLLCSLFIYCKQQEQKVSMSIWHALEIIESHNRMHICNASFFGLLEDWR